MSYRSSNFTKCGFEERKLENKTKYGQKKIRKETSQRFLDNNVMAGAGRSLSGKLLSIFLSQLYICL